MKYMILTMATLFSLNSFAGVLKCDSQEVHFQINSQDKKIEVSISDLNGKIHSRFQDSIQNLGLKYVGDMAQFSIQFGKMGVLSAALFEDYSGNSFTGGAFIESKGFFENSGIKMFYPEDPIEMQCTFVK
ncbi:hypothetical protein [Bdellovibrio sp. HCB2-146]|uniref:hypothetical protein n=1 Tax=Bdellovibrio sp. HCB2-146 TaxID=3394362 RepID=UPI0039BC624E